MFSLLVRLGTNWQVFEYGHPLPLASLHADVNSARPFLELVVTPLALSHANQRRVTGIWCVKSRTQCTELLRPYLENDVYNPLGVIVVGVPAYCWVGVLLTSLISS